ncbi:MAG TPA: TonB-dependent receptor plug domain-containing protein [Chitinophagaceae bacterium]|mgnify:CR=1 FL=1|nr:TonB-dependent receptor plug domain-containing protein [Chitinophagaceae bacterium]
MAFVLKMRLKFLLLVFIYLFELSNLNAQSLFSGVVQDQQSQFVHNAKVQWAGSTNSVLTNSNGNFQIPFPADSNSLTHTLIVSVKDAVDSFELDDLYSPWTFTLSVQVVLREVRILEKNTGAYISELQPFKTEIINRNELRKAACCDLAGCFETQSTVQPQTTNILTNAKELRILGLSGIYNQVLVDGMPIIQGLTYTYGISTIPGSMVENIWVVKGANSVVQGYESMVGQITVFPREGGTADPFTTDVLINSFGEKHLNASAANQGKKWTNYLAVHASLPGEKFDRDHDQFLDLPLLTRYSIYNKWRYRKENENGFSSFVGVRYVDEKRIGGNTNFIPLTDIGTTASYGQVVEFIQPEIYTKSGYRFDENTKVSLFLSNSFHQQNSWFGLVQYKAQQNYLYSNLQFEKFYGKNKQHDFKAGISYRYINANEDINFSSSMIVRTFNGRYIRNEKVLGGFAENIFKSNNEKITLITGLRLDHHNQFGFKLTPRMMIKYQPKEKTDLRASIGTGWRTVNLFSENLNLLTSNRDIIFLESLKPEQSVNAGLNATQKWRLGNVDFVGTIDFYHTRFQRQFFPDYDSNYQTIYIKNFTGKAVSNGFQAELSASFNEMINIRTAYNYLDVYREINGSKVLLPYNASHRFLAVMSLHSKKPLWQFDMNLHWYGKQRLPNSQSLPIIYQQPSTSQPFSMLSLQYTHSFKEIELFGGCENIFDFRQKRPIVGYEDPFGKYFDTSFAWGPTRGREFYIGFRLKLLNKEKVEN